MPIGIFTTSHSGVDVLFEWKIDFFTLPGRGDKNYYSPLFSFGVERWFLVIYPNGSSERDSSGQVDLELCKRFSGRSKKQSFSLSLKTVKGEKYNEQHVTKDFDDINCYHTVNRVISRSDLTKRRSELVPEGLLTVVCTMKNTMSARSATANDLEHAYVGVSTQRVRASTQRVVASTQHVGASTQHVRASTRRLRASTQRVRASTQTMEASTQTVEASTQTVETCTQTVETSTQTVEEKYEAAASGSATNFQEKKALHDYKELLLKKEDCDVTIKVKRSEFLANRVILKSRSPVLASTFRHDMKESAAGVLETDDCDPEHAYVGASTPHVGPSTRRLRASTRRLRASTRRLRASTRRLKASTRRLRASTQCVRASTQTVEASTQTVEEKYEGTASGSSTNSQEKKALLDFKKLFLKKEDCDVTIKVKSSEFVAHRVILKARSPVLASTFRNGMKESATGVLEIDDCDPSSFSHFLCFLYCAEVQLITQKCVFDLFTLADKYQVLDLRSKCLEFMKNNLTVDTFCETITLALRHSETDLIKLCTDYFTKNAPKIIVTVKWQTFLAENPTESNELFIKLLVLNSS